MDTFSPLKLPKYKVVASSGGSDDQQRQNMFEAFDWAEGIPIKEHRTTPILFHRGTWNGFYNYPIELDTDIVNELGSTTIKLYLQQFGTGFGIKDGLVRVPTTILANCLKQSPDQFQMEFNGGLFFNNLVNSLFDELTAKNVFTASVPTWTGYSYLTLPFPGIDELNIDGNGIYDFQKVVDENRFEGGNLLYLCSVHINSYNSGATQGIYYKTNMTPITDEEQITIEIPQYGPIPGFTYTPGKEILDTNTVRLSNDKDILARCFPRFRRFKCIIYLRRFHDEEVEKGVAALMQPIHEALISEIQQYNFVKRGPYHVTEDITEVVKNDIVEWLETL